MTTQSIDLTQFNGFTCMEQDPTGSRWFLIFTVDKCRNCGSEIQGPNALQIAPHSGEATLVMLGLKRYEKAPASAYYNDSNPSEESCDNCEVAQ